MDTRIEELKRQYYQSEDPKIGLALLNVMLRSECHDPAAKRSGFISVPQLGTKITLSAPWTFMLYHENRNYYLRELFYPGVSPDQGDFVAHIPAGAVLIVDRVYIRRGQDDYNSVTFRIEDCPVKFEGRTYKKIRFWAKLGDVNRIIGEFDELPVSPAPDYSPIVNEYDAAEYLQRPASEVPEVDWSVERVLERRFCGGRWEKVSLSENVDIISGRRRAYGSAYKWVARRARVSDLIQMTPGEILGIPYMSKSYLKRMEDHLALYGLKLKNKGKRGSKKKVPQPVPTSPDDTVRYSVVHPEEESVKSDA